ncbi:2'-5' RNA ligase family protein [Gramella sp. GC03-9]|uniref:2'-5' RNA ligase family protein n=1 Tax=Christiangramia oceanisediminis TaxID=2920386 RepID=A0A9X2KWE5_9FLAO|nr:2'-5' RNA ligase family protein [Gramella oceanisediminis]MCP9199785.1 2'-5' RNA ligase family protein [Gramella oceanisediminis]
MSTKRDPLYFICLMPPSGIKSEIEKIKKEIQAEFGISHALKLPAHITVKIPFRFNENKEASLLKKLQNFSAELKPISINLKDFGRFDKKVIFINVLDHEPIIQLHTNLQGFIGELTQLKKHELASKIHPHVTIATRDLKRTDFPQVWANFKDRYFAASFIAKHLFLLKHNGKTWDILRKFDFNKE